MAGVGVDRREWVGTVSRYAGTILVWDMKAKRVTLDGRDIAPADQIGSDFAVDVEDGLFGALTLTLYADNILIRSESGETTSPTASDEGRRIVREGLSDVLAWLGETP